MKDSDGRTKINRGVFFEWKKKKNTKNQIQPKHDQQQAKTNGNRRKSQRSVLVMEQTKNTFFMRKDYVFPNVYWIQMNFISFSEISLNALLSSDPFYLLACFFGPYFLNFNWTNIEAELNVFGCRFRRKINDLQKENQKPDLIANAFLKHLFT